MDDDAEEGNMQELLLIDCFSSEDDFCQNGGFYKKYIYIVRLKERTFLWA